MPQRPTRSGSRSTPNPAAPATPVLAALEAFGFAFGRTLSAAAAPAPAARGPSEPPKAPRRRRALKAVAGKARAVVKAVKRTASEPPVAKAAKGTRRKRRARTAATEPPAARVVTAKPPIIRRKVVKPARPAVTAPADASAAGVEAAPGPAVDPGPPPAHGLSRGDRVWFRQDGAVAEGEVARVTPDGSLVVMPLPAGDRLILAPADLVAKPQP